MLYEQVVQVRITEEEEVQRCMTYRDLPSDLVQRRHHLGDLDRESPNPVAQLFPDAPNVVYTGP